MKTLRIPGYFIVMVAVMAGPSCMADGERVADNQIMSFEDFEAQAYREADSGMYIVNGDTPVENIEQLRVFYDRMVQGALIVHQVNGVDAKWTDTEKVALTYCVSTTFAARYNTMVQVMEAATEAWEKVARVDFIHLAAEDTRCTAFNNAVVFDVRPVSGEPYLARAFFPNFARARRNILVDSAAFGNVAPYTLTGILTHELGHALGFRHEHTRPEAGTCYEDDNWRALTPYDSNSIMHYPWCNGTNQGDLVLTFHDKLGARILYGAWPDRLMLINRSGAGGHLMIADFSAGQAPAEVVYQEDWGDSDLLSGWHDDNDRQLVGDFMNLGYDQVMFINGNSTGSRVMIASFRPDQPAKIHYIEVYGQSTLLDGWHDSGDLLLTGDFAGLGYDQVMFINRSGGGGRVLIADFKSGSVPATVRYQEAWGQSAVLDGWHDDGDLRFAGDFMNLGYDQVMFINRSGGDGRVMIADFKGRVVSAAVLYLEVWGRSAMLDGWYDDGDLQLAGDFMNAGYDQLMFINRSGGGGRVMIADFSDGTVPIERAYLEVWGQNAMLDGWHDEGDLRFAGDFAGLGYDQVMFINRSGGSGKVLVADFSVGAAPAAVRYFEVWGQSAVLNTWLDSNDVQLVGDFRAK